MSFHAHTVGEAVIETLIKIVARAIVNDIGGIPFLILLIIGGLIWAVVQMRKEPKRPTLLGTDERAELERLRKEATMKVNM